MLFFIYVIYMAYWLFGIPTRLYATGGHLSDLEMDEEDTADIVMSCKQGAQVFPVHVHLDFLQKPARRYLHIVGDKGKLLFDAIANRLEVNLIGGDKADVTLFDKFQRNDMFLAEVRDFIKSVQQGTAPAIPLEEGAAVLRICLAAKQSLSERQAFEF